MSGRTFSQGSATLEEAAQRGGEILIFEGLQGLLEKVISDMRPNKPNKKRNTQLKKNVHKSKKETKQTKPTNKKNTIKTPGRYIQF